MDPSVTTAIIESKVPEGLSFDLDGDSVDSGKG